MYAVAVADTYKEDKSNSNAALLFASARDILAR